MGKQVVFAVVGKLEHNGVLLGLGVAKVPVELSKKPLLAYDASYFLARKSPERAMRRTGLIFCWH
mgnify:CR=1 FL=1